MPIGVTKEMFSDHYQSIMEMPVQNTSLGNTLCMPRNYMATKQRRLQRRERKLSVVSVSRPVTLDGTVVL